MNVTLQLTDGSGPVLELSFMNDVSKILHLAAPRINPETLDGNYFQFRPAGVPFLGRQVKRGPYTINELLELPPGESLTSTFDLKLFYDLTSGLPKSVRYRATHPVAGPGQLELLESPWLALA